MSKENASYGALCAMTDELFAAGKGGYGSRRDAFNAACQKRPDLARGAIGPTGEPLVPGGGAPQSFEEAMAAVADSPLVKAAEECAAAHARSGR